MATTGSLINHLYSNSNNPLPTVGDGATMLYWTDRQACTVVEVSPKRIVVQEDKATRTDNLGMSDCQSYSYERNPNGAKYTFTLRNNGRWVRQGDTKRGQGIRFGTRDQYHDYGF